MTPHVSEAQFERDIEAALVQDGLEGTPAGQVAEPPEEYGEGRPGGYHRREPGDYDRALCLIPKDLVAFVQATQPEEWKKLEAFHGKDTREELVKRIARDIEKRGTLHALRQGLKVSGVRFDLAYFRPSSGLNVEHRRRYRANIFSVIRQLKYSEHNDSSLDLHDYERELRRLEQKRDAGAELVMTQPVEIPLYGKLSRPEYSKEELLEIWQKMRDQYRLNIQTGEKLIDLKKEDKAYLIKTDKNQYSAQSVVLALGRRGTPRKLGVSGEDRAKVMYKLMDAESYQKHNILIVGGGDSAIEAAIGLARQKGNRVTISYRKEKFFRIKTRNEQRVGEMIDTGKINALFSSNVISIEKDKVILETTDGQQTIPNDYVFIFAGGEPPFKLLKQFGIRFGGAYNS